MKMPSKETLCKKYEELRAYADKEKELEPIERDRVLILIGEALMLYLDNVLYSGERSPLKEYLESLEPKD